MEDFILPYSAVPQNYWNRSTFAKVIVKIKVARFLWPTVYIRRHFYGGLRKNILLLQEWRFGRSRSSKVIDFDTNQKAHMWLPISP